MSDATCVRFKKRTTEKDYVFYYYGGSGCNTQVGKTSGRHVINLSPGIPGRSYPCAHSSSTVVHETMHALGCHHEMARPDRDKYVTIVESNIQPGKQWSLIRHFRSYATNTMIFAAHKHNFLVAPNQTTFGIPFDYTSVMMYTWNAFAINRKKSTIIPKQPGVKKESLRGQKMSKNDIALINTMYKCKKQNDIDDADDDDHDDDEDGDE